MWCYLKEAEYHKEVISGVAFPMCWRRKSSTLKKLAFDVTNDKIDQLNIQLGEILTVQFDINAREYNGRWFNSINAWNVIRQTQQAPAQGGGFSGNVQSVAQAAQQAMASSANAAGVANPMNQQNLFPPAQQSAQTQGDSSDLPF